MIAPHPLDRPIWAALRHRWAAVALGDPARALRLEPRYWPLAAAADPQDAAAVAALLAPGETLSLIEAAPVEAPAGVQARHLGIRQMTAEAVDGPEPAFAWRPLGAADAAEMLALAEDTQPGPFSIDTWRLGAFIGVHDEGRLVAMAGERMGAPGFGELSGVCSAPSHQGRGLAAGLMRLVARRILARGEVVFLHAHTHNASAIALHERVGFRTRRALAHTLLTRVEAAS